MAGLWHRFSTSWRRLGAAAISDPSAGLGLTPLGTGPLGS